MNHGNKASARELEVLLVDDDDVDVEAARRALDRIDKRATLTTARDGVEALQLLRMRKGRLPVVLLDLNMPKMTGLELLRELRNDARLKDVAVIVVSTSDDAADVAASRDLLVQGYLVKPIDHARLNSLLLALKR